jgi:hypothetical protein
MLMRLVLFTTSDLRAGREADFIRMVESIGQHPKDTEIKIFALLQRAGEADRLRYERILPCGSVVVAHPERVSLSAARNRLLDIAHDHNAVTDDCIVGFPDDDCWYPRGFVHYLVQSFFRDPRLDMLACRVSLQPTAADLIELSPTPARALQVVRRSSSNSMFFRGRLVAALGAFDPTLGLGTPNGSGEDTDYALRGFLRARRAAFINVPLVGHRESDLSSVARYFRGSVIVLGRYALRSPGLFFEFTRKLVVGAYLALRSSLTIQGYLASIVRSFGELQRSVLCSGNREKRDDRFTRR